MYAVDRPEESGEDTAAIDERQHQAWLLYVSMIGVAAGTIFFILAAAATQPFYLTDSVIPWLNFPLLALVYLMWRRGSLRWGSLLLVCGVFLTLAASALYLGGIRSPGFNGLLTVAILAGMLINFRAGAIFAAAGILFGALLLALELVGRLPAPPVPYPTILFFITHAAYTLGSIAALYLATQSVRRAHERVQREIDIRRRSVGREVTHRRLAEKDLRRNLAQLQALHQIDQAITSRLELRELLHVILTQARQIIPCDTISLQVLRGERLQIAACLGFERAEEVLGLTFALDPKFPNERVIREKAPVAYLDIPKAFPHFQQEADRFSSGKIRSWMGVPLIVGDTPIGMIALDRNVVDPFSDEELETAAAFATQAAIAIQNAQLYERLEVSESNYRSIFEGIQDAILVESPEGDILDVNQRACDMYGYPREEFLRLKVHDLVPEGATIVLPDLLTEDQPGDQVYETENLRASGERFPAQLTARLQIVGGRQVMLVVVRDASETHQTRRRAEQQTRLASVGQLAAGIAHDFNNILGTIMLYGELIREEASDPSRIEGRVHTIVDQAARGSRLIQQILDFSRRSIMETHTVDFVPFLRDLRVLLSRTLRENVRIRLEVEDDRPLKLNADPTRLQQILMNLALNAHEAMPEGGELTLSLDEIEVAPGNPPLLDMEPGRWIRLRVSDMGEGIPPENLPHIYEPFFTTKEPGKGTGLGLAQVYGIVKQHDGYIDVESEVGRGTTFTLYFPALPETAAVSRAAEQPQAFVGSGELVLVVEDDEVLQQALADSLEALNLKTLSATNGAEALALFRERRAEIKFVLSDLVMPEMGGRRLFEELQRLDPQVKVVFMTGYPIGTRTHELFDVNQVAWLQKPFTVQEISRAISRVYR